LLWLFWRWVLLFPPGYHSLPILDFLPYLGWQVHITTPSFSVEMGSHELFFAQAGLESQSSWSQSHKYYRCEPWMSGYAKGLEWEDVSLWPCLSLSSYKYLRGVPLSIKLAKPVQWGNKNFYEKMFIWATWLLKRMLFNFFTKGLFLKECWFLPVRVER
jgi:hypothetical protein